MGRRAIFRTGLVALLATACSHVAAAQPVFNGDPIDPATGKAYMLLPGVPLVYPGPDGRYGTADDVIDTSITGDIDVVLRTGGTFAGGAIPPPAAGVAAAPIIIAGGLNGKAGTQVPFQMILSDGQSPPAVGSPLLGPDLDARRALITAYADLDGDGFIGPTATASPADIEVERQEAFTFAGRAMAEIQNGVASGKLGVAMGAPASAGGLGIVVCAGAVTGPTPNLYADGPWVATSLPYMIPLDQAKIVGGEPTGPIDPIGLVDLELEQSSLFLPAPNHPQLGTPYAIPLDGSNVTVDLLHSNSGAAVGADFARPIDRATFVAQWGRLIRAAVNANRQRDLVESVDALSLPADGPDNSQTVLVYPADLFGNPTDPPAGGLVITLQVGPALSIVAPDTDGDPRSETIVFDSPAYVAVTVDDAGVPRTTSATDRLVAVHDGVPTGRVTFMITAGPGGGTIAPQAAMTRLHRALRPGHDRIQVNTSVDASAATDPATQSVSVALDGPTGSIYTRVFPAGTFKASANGRTFMFKDRTTRMSIRRGAANPQALSIKLRARRLDLSAAPPSLGALSVVVEIGSATFHSTLTCTESPSAMLTRCGP